jgi:hypothetical protein
VRCAAASLVLILMGPSAAQGATADQAAAQAALNRYVQKELAPLEWSLEDRALTATHLQVAWLDLNFDHKPEAIVYLSGRAYCGTGGCNVLILERTGGTFRVRGNLSVSQLPVGALRQSTKGWRDLTVAVRGRGIPPGYTAVVPFDGQRYASNPTSPPAYQLKAPLAEDVLIPDDLYPFLGVTPPSERPTRRLP